MCSLLRVMRRARASTNRLAMVALLAAVLGLKRELVLKMFQQLRVPPGCSGSLILQRMKTFIHYTLPVLTGARRKTRMTTYQTTNAVAGSTQEVMKVQYTAKTHTSGGRRGGVSSSHDGRLDVKFSTPVFP